MRDFDEVLLDVFGEKSREFSEDLRARVRQIHREGIKVGLYLERERLPVPQDVFDVWERPAEPVPEDPRRAPGRYGEIEHAKTELVEAIEDLAIEVEHRIQPERTLGAGGVDLVKARHQLLTQIMQLTRAIGRLAKQVREFR